MQQDEVLDEELRPRPSCCLHVSSVFHDSGTVFVSSYVDKFSQ